jgi:hypothetical protein
VLIFLSRQNAAAALRFWPGKSDERAHGVAARHQARAEAAAKNIDPRFATALREDRLTVKKRTVNGRKRLRLLLDGRRVLTVLVEEQRTMALRSRCQCGRADGRPRSLKSCGSHALDFAALALSLNDWEIAEAAFYRSLREGKAVCCGTMDDCPLAAGQLVLHSAA